MHDGRLPLVFYTRSLHSIIACPVRLHQKTPVTRDALVTIAMTSYILPPIGILPILPISERAKILDHLFEPSEPLRILCEPLLNGTSFSSYDDMISQIQVRLEDLLTSSTDNDTCNSLDQILGSHPRLGGKIIKSTQSQAEQARLSSPNEPEDVKLAEMNALYEQKFPGLRYVVFVKGRSRGEILNNMRVRIDRANFKMEREEAITAMCEIASDRAHKSSSNALTTETGLETAYYPTP
ncbi:MAG: hypothetical protein Q9217_002041 [Psora testacea]